MNKIVLVGVVKSQRDLDILLHEHWYRIPVAHAPTQKYQYLAFYQPVIFGRQGRCIRYYARVLDYKTIRRDRLLPNEPHHPRARGLYLKIRIGKIQRLSRPVRNIIPRRVTFGFTILHRLRTARDMLQLYDVVPIEQMMGDALERAGITTLPEHTVVSNDRRYRLDFAIICARGKIAIECDNTTSHKSPKAREKDKQKDRALRACGWSVLRFSEDEIVSHLPHYIARIKNAVTSIS